ncbi:MAG: UbiA-like polyprenyltransferase [Anaerolineaceae bacterium]
MKQIREFLELVKFEHSIFALPFAYIGMLAAAGGWPTLAQFLWITVAMVAARTLAMGTNRIADRTLDARNPRTRNRPLVTGAVGQKTAWLGTALSLAVLVLTAWRLGQLPLKLLPGAVVFLIGYSFTKRFTVLSHFILGFTDGLAPVGAWVVVRGSLFTIEDAPAWVLLAIVTLWIGGFDLLYACQDTEFDREFKLHAIPARYGPAFALRLSVACHILMMALLVLFGALMCWSWPYWLAMVIITALLVWEHSLVHPEDLSRIDLAFFNINSYIALALFAGVLGAIFL